MGWKHWIEIIGMATALAALFGVFGILLNVFIHGQFYTPTADIFINEPQVYVLIVEILLVVFSIPVMIYIGIKDIKGLSRLKEKANKIEIIERKASSIFLRAIFIGLTMTLIVGLIVYVDDMHYRNENLKYNIKKMNSTIIELDITIEFLQEELIDYSEKIENLTLENDMLRNVS